jgi:hypothetical protein
MNRNGARQRPYHALTAASSGFIPTMLSMRVYGRNHRDCEIGRFLCARISVVRPHSYEEDFPC